MVAVWRSARNNAGRPIRKPAPQPVSLQRLWLRRRGLLLILLLLFLLDNPQLAVAPPNDNNTVGLLHQVFSSA